MNKKMTMMIGAILLFGAFLGVILWPKDKEVADTEEIIGTVMQYDANTVTVQDVDLGIYTFQLANGEFALGDELSIQYAGVLEKNKSQQSGKVVNYKVVDSEVGENGIPVSWDDYGIFHTYYKLAYDKLMELSLKERIGQILLVHYPGSNAVDLLNDAPVSGFIFFSQDFQDKTKSDVIDMINSLQNASTIPLLTAVDEEGGSVVRVSSNSNLVDTPFPSPSALYDAGGFDQIAIDTVEKSKVLADLGLNLNLAPVVDVATNPSSYIYERTLKQGTSLTSTFAKTVIEASKGTGVSYTLKHFPGYGDNDNTHTGVVTDSRSYSEIETTSLPPFQSGIAAGAEAIMVNHNIVTNIDPDQPATLSQSVHNLLRNELAFTGIIMTDDLSMAALDEIDDVYVKAILAGNDLLITVDYQEAFDSIQNAVLNGTISEAQIDKLAFRVLAWKYSKLLFLENQK